MLDTFRLTAVSITRVRFYLTLLPFAYRCAQIWSDGYHDARRGVSQLDTAGGRASRPP